MQALKDLFVGLSWPALILIGLGIWYVAKHGVPAAAAKATALAAKISALWNGGVADVKAVQTALAGEVAVIKADIATIKNHVGIPTPGA